MPKYVPPEAPAAAKGNYPGQHTWDGIKQQAAQKSHKADDDIPDMFELARDHPESFGSSELLEAEQQHPSNPPKAK
jgi:hypothetical protein